MYEIEKGVPVAVNRAPNARYPLKAMAVGDSFLIPDEDLNRSANVHASAAHVGIRVRTRTVEGGRRVWRVA